MPSATIRSMDRQTEALLLRVSGLTYREIGERLGVTRARALQLVNAARASGRYSGRAGVVSQTVEGMPAEALGDAIRTYLASLGIPEERAGVSK